MIAERKKEPQSSLFDQILAHAKEEGRNVAFEAVEHLKDPNEIRAFFRDYARYLEENLSDRYKETPPELAGVNINTVLRLIESPKATKLWYSAIEGLKPS